MPAPIGKSELVDRHSSWLHDYFDGFAQLNSIGLHASRDSNAALICITDSGGQVWHRWRHVISPMSVRFAIVNFEQQRDQWVAGDPRSADVGVRVSRADAALLRGR